MGKKDRQLLVRGFVDVGRLVNVSFFWMDVSNPFPWVSGSWPVNSQRVPKHDAFNRAFNRLTPDTLHAVNDAVIAAAVDRGLEDGTKLRVDTTVLETDIHHPTDNRLLWDSVRVLTRLVRHLHDLLPTGVGPFTNRTRAARRRMHEIERMTAKARHTQQVPTEDKLYSIFKTHTDLIKRGKVLKPVEFGHKVFLAESGGGLITQYHVLTGNPADQVHVTPSLERHTQAFGHAPDLYSSDRGFFNAANLEACQTAGVTCTCIPQAGGTRSAEREALEKSPAFKQGQRFRAGIEGRISVLFRGRGMKRAFVEGRERFELLVGAAVLANNLMVIAELLRRTPARRRRPAVA